MNKQRNDFVRLLLMSVTIILSTFQWKEAHCQSNNDTLPSEEYLENINMLLQAHDMYLMLKSGEIASIDATGILEDEYKHGQLKIFYPNYKSGAIDEVFNNTELRKLYYDFFNEKEVAIMRRPQLEQQLKQGKLDIIRDMERVGDRPRLERIQKVTKFFPEFVEQTFGIYCLYRDGQFSTVGPGPLGEFNSNGKLLVHRQNLESGYYDRIFKEPELLNYYQQLEERNNAVLNTQSQEILKVDKSLKLFEMHERKQLDMLYKTVSSGNLLTLLQIIGKFPCGKTPVGTKAGCVAHTEKNSVLTRTFDDNGKVLSETIVYIDGMGREVQTQAKVISENKILATQVLYDAFGREAIRTLASPTNRTSFTYIDRFITNKSTGRNYAPDDYDATATLNNPNQVQNNTAGTLGYYYSDNNSVEPFVPASSFPYVRTEYTADPYSETKRTAKAGENYKMGSGHEQRVFNMSSGNELDNVFGTGNSYRVQLNLTDRLQSSPINISGGIQLMKQIAIDEDGLVNITYANNAGNVVATCKSGLTTSCSSQQVTQKMLYNGQKSIDIHLPASQKTTLRFLSPIFLFGFGLPFPIPIIIPFSDINYSITDLNTNKKLIAGTDYSIAGDGKVTFSGTQSTGDGFYRISFDYSESIKSFLTAFHGIIPDASLSYQLDYSQWGFNYYDFAGRLRKEVSPKGFDCSNPGTITMAITYDYSSLGQLIAMESPDEGKTEYLYDNEGKIRFSQNAKQRQEDKFSYVNYDKSGRATEKGEFISSGSSMHFRNYYGLPFVAFSPNILTILNQLDGVDDAHCSQRNFFFYDKTDASEEIPSGYGQIANYSQRFLDGQLVKSSNDNSSTWYSYNQFENMTFAVQQIKEADFVAAKPNMNDQIKTLDYLYLPLTNQLTETRYQQYDLIEKLVHYFSYDADGRLLKTEASGPDGIKKPIGRYEYYLHGALKRKELGDNLQGIDYVWTINGELKGINHPSLDNQNDPGKDGYGAGTHKDFAQDVFGMNLDYHYQDYARTGTNIISSLTTVKTGGHFNGLIDAMRYKTRDAYKIERAMQNPVTLINNTNEELMNRFGYDNQNRMQSGSFGVFNSSTKNFAARSEFKEYGITYDNNGNILTLQRNGYAGTIGLVMDDLSYTYASNSNRLVSVTDNATANYGNDFNTAAGNDFTYNAIGQMVSSQPEGISNMEYDANGLATRTDFVNGSIAEYKYNEQGQKMMVKFTEPGGSGGSTQWYVRDIGGNITAIYERDDVKPIQLTEQPLYCSERAGVWNRISNEMQFELTDHLGNVRAVVTKRGGDAIALNQADYYPFGGLMPGRTLNPTDYKFGYQGQENAAGNNWKQFDLRMYNTSLGRWITPDPYRQYHSSYSAMGNNPVRMTDPDGGRTVSYGRGEEVARRDYSYRDNAFWLFSFGGGGSLFGGGGGGGGIGGTGSGSYNAWNNFNASEWAGGLLEGYVAGQALGYNRNEAVQFASDLSVLAGGNNYEVNAWYRDVGADNDRSNDFMTGIELVTYNKSGQKLGTQSLYEWEPGGSGTDYSGLANYGNALLGTTGTLINYARSAGQNIIAKELIQTGNFTKEMQAAGAELKGLGAIMKKLGGLGVAFNTFSLGAKYLSGETIRTSDLIDLGINVGLAALTLTNPVAITALGIYAVTDYYGTFNGIKKQYLNQPILNRRR